jgi:hypothetical protein
MTNIENNTEKWYIKNGKFTLEMFRPLSMKKLADIIPYIDVHHTNDFVPPPISHWYKIHAQGFFIYFHQGKTFTDISDFSKITRINRYPYNTIFFQPKNINIFSKLETHLKERLKTTNLFKRPFYSRLLSDLEESGESIIFTEENELPVKFGKKTKVQMKLDKKLYIEKTTTDLKRDDLCGLMLYLNGIIIKGRTIKVIIKAKSILLYQNPQKCIPDIPKDFFNV